MKNRQGILLVVGIIAVGALAFLAGTQYRGRFAPVSRTFVRRGVFPMMGRQPEFRSGIRGNRTGYSGVIQGQVQKVDGNSVTITRPNGSTYTVTVTGQTPVEKTVSGTQSDIKTGETITIYGSPTATGSYTVQSVVVAGQ